MYPAKYPVDGVRLAKDFVYHAPFGDQAARYGVLREAAKDLAEIIMGQCPPSRETSVALTNLEQVVFWANAAIARNEAFEEGYTKDQ
jgi:hypothetical protein